MQLAQFWSILHHVLIIGLPVDFSAGPKRYRWPRDGKQPKTFHDPYQLIDPNEPVNQKAGFTNSYFSQTKPEAATRVQSSELVSRWRINKLTSTAVWLVLPRFCSDLSAFKRIDGLELGDVWLKGNGIVQSKLVLNSLCHWACLRHWGKPSGLPVTYSAFLVSFLDVDIKKTSIHILRVKQFCED